MLLGDFIVFGKVMPWKVTKTVRILYLCIISKIFEIACNLRRQQTPSLAFMSFGLMEVSRVVGIFSQL